MPLKSYLLQINCSIHDKGTGDQPSLPLCTFPCENPQSLWTFFFALEDNRKIVLIGLQSSSHHMWWSKVQQKMFAMHSLSQEGLAYKTLNVFMSGVSDPPHLLKTARYCIASKKRLVFTENETWNFKKFIYFLSSVVGRVYIGTTLLSYISGIMVQWQGPLVSRLCTS